MRRRRRNISVYIDTSGSGGRGWVTHLLHLAVEEGGGVESFSTKYPLSFVSRLHGYILIKAKIMYTLCVSPVHLYFDLEKIATKVFFRFSASLGVQGTCKKISPIFDHRKCYF